MSRGPAEPVQVGRPGHLRHRRRETRPRSPARAGRCDRTGGRIALLDVADGALTITQELGGLACPTAFAVGRFGSDRLLDVAADLRGAEVTIVMNGN
ncbi:MAG TPA: hypothetical protein VGJ71_01175 [Candidatus Limnocylindrales bacterium]